MKKITSLEDLNILSATVRKERQSLTDLTNKDNKVLIKVAIATCSNAAGAERIFNLISGFVEKRGINAVIMKTGCMGYCYAEPTIEVTLPGRSPVTFGDVTESKADEIVENYIKNGQKVPGVIELNYNTIYEI